TPPSPTLSPYTTLFRSGRSTSCRDLHCSTPHSSQPSPPCRCRNSFRAGVRRLQGGTSPRTHWCRTDSFQVNSMRDRERWAAYLRSEEHTSELQSPDHLV